MSAAAPGIQQNIVLDGTIFAVPASAVRWRAARAETVERLLNGYAVIDRPFVFDNAPTVITKYSFDLAYPSIAEADYRAFTEVEVRAGFFDLCIWKPISETFSPDGTSTVYTILRRVALAALDGGLIPAGASTTYATSITLSGVTVDPNDYTIGTPDADTGATPITFDNAPAAGEDTLRVFYVPLFYVRVLDPERDLSTPFIETTTLRLEEA